MTTDEKIMARIDWLETRIRRMEDMALADTYRRATEILEEIRANRRAVEQTLNEMADDIETMTGRQVDGD